MKGLIVRHSTEDPTTIETFELLTLRYKAAYAEYQEAVDKNAELSLNGHKPSAESLREEEQAFEELDCARYALLDAAAQAYPTIH